MSLAVCAAIALVLDLVVGEPPAAVHPVVWMGRAAGWLRERAPARGRRTAGVALALGLPALFAAAAWASLRVPWAAWALATWWIWSCFSIRVLGEAGSRVGAAVRGGDLETAREGMSWLCSRDPRGLSGPELAAAAIESLAENASDSAVAPAFWLAVGGLPGIVAYRCVNTLDAMVGYRDRYPRLGWASARLDDLLNLVPARLTAGLLVLLGGGRSAARIAWRDAGLTDSPNAGWPMAAMAGHLGLRLAKRGQYALNAEGRAASGEDVAAAWRLARRAMLAAWLIAVASLQLRG